MLTTTIPVNYAAAVTASDSADVAAPNNRVTMRGITVNADGNINVDFTGGGTQIVIAVKAGTFYPFNLKRVRSTSTTATGIVAYF